MCVLVCIFIYIYTIYIRRARKDNSIYRVLFENKRINYGPLRRPRPVVLFAITHFGILFRERTALPSSSSQVYTACRIKGPFLHVVLYNISSSTTENSADACGGGGGGGALADGRYDGLASRFWSKTHHRRRTAKPLFAPPVPSRVEFSIIPSTYTTRVLLSLDDNDDYPLRSRFASTTW